MLSVLEKIKIEIKEDIKQTQRLFDDNPMNDYYQSEIFALKRSLARVEREESKELNCLDAWAVELSRNEKIRKEIENGCNKKSTGV